MPLKPLLKCPSSPSRNSCNASHEITLKSLLNFPDCPSDVPAISLDSCFLTFPYALARFRRHHAYIDRSTAPQATNRQCLEPAYSTLDAGRERKKYAALVRRQVGISSGYDGWTSRPDLLLTGVPKLPRCYDGLNLRWALQVKHKATPGTTSAELRANLWHDLSQNMRGVSTRTRPGTHCTSGCWYSYQHDTIIDGSDCMRLQGWAKEKANTREHTPSGLKDLASEGYMLACMSTVMLAVTQNPFAPWHSKASTASPHTSSGSSA